MGNSDSQLQEMPMPKLPTTIENILSKLPKFQWDLAKTPLASLTCYKIKKTGAQQQGEWENMKKVGQGRELRLILDEVYQQEGNFDNDFWNGAGRCISQSGEYQEGQFLEGQPNGEGTFTTATNAIFKGNFIGFGWNQLNGKGIQRMPNGATYEGFFRNGQEHGEGTLINPDHSRWNGEFVNGHFVQGTMYWPDQSRQIGQIKDGKFNGIGSQHYTDGSVFNGNFADGMKNGQGLLTKGSMEIDGNWVKNELNGICFLRDGTKSFEVHFEKGKEVLRKEIT